MALKTEDDYQDEIDDLKKEIDRLYDEGTDKGFKLKREEKMEEEVRAFKTQRDYQKEINRLKGLIVDYQEEKERAEREVKKYQEYIDKYDDTLREYKNDMAKWSNTIKIAKNQIKKFEEKMNDVYFEGTGKGFNLKRSQETDFETRKNSILADLTDLEER